MGPAGLQCIPVLGCPEEENYMTIINKTSEKITQAGAAL